MKVAEKHQGNNEHWDVMKAASALFGELALKMNQVANIMTISMCLTVNFDYLFGSSWIYEIV